ncbi:hypothetical protein HU200_063147 [Digitaria exilis]|uniref:OTU domain-containing protein n=1 Tax=Digitaria exilis TaxID=1010633 RepID=A0A835ADT0_9POAL|nr:hypothetical protein HU200_063147 [Digitaria exilis]
MVQNKKKAAAPAKLRKPPRDAEKKLGKKAGMTEFRAQLDSLGLKIVEVNADGKCFFRAMGDQLECSEAEHMKYRAMVVDYIVKHREDFEPFIEDEVPFKEYCDSMLKDGTWAGHMELQAASLLTRKKHMHSHGLIVMSQTDANISSTDNNAQTKARSTYDQTSVKLVMAGTVCSDAAIAQHVSCSLATASPREPPRAKGGQGKGQKGKKQKKKEQAAAVPVKVKESVVEPDLGALCIRTLNELCCALMTCSYSAALVVISHAQLKRMPSAEC